MSIRQRLSQLFGRPAPDPQNDPDTLRAIGDTVRERLLADPRVEPRGGAKADLFLLRGLLTQQQCRKLIRVIDSRIQPSVLFSDKVSPSGADQLDPFLPGRSTRNARSGPQDRGGYGD